MPTRTQVLIPVGVAAIIIGIAGVISIPSEVKLEVVEFPRGTIKVDDVVLEVQIADTSPRHVRGLMFQEELPFDEGMLLVFEDMGVRSIWMLNMQFPLDIIWFDENGNVVYMEKEVPICKTALETVTCPSYDGGGKQAQYVLEVTSGFIDEFGINNQSVLEIISI